MLKDLFFGWIEEEITKFRETLDNFPNFILRFLVFHFLSQIKPGYLLNNLLIFSLPGEV